MKERRKLERFDLELLGRVEFINETHKEEMLNLLTCNVCSGGAYFSTSQLLPEGTRVKIDLVLPLDKLTRLKDEFRHAYIKVTGRVLRSESGGMAICFDEDYEIMGAGM